MDTISQWREVSVWAATWHSAEDLAARTLGPRFDELEAGGVLAGWWFIRKGLEWRIRYLPAPGRDDDARTAITDALVPPDGRLGRWTHTIYEPPVHAFGGPEVMEVAHELFRADSRHVLDYMRRGGGHRRELGVLLVTAMARSASRDWYDQGHLWQLIAEERTAPTAPPTREEAAAVHDLLTAYLPHATAAAGAPAEWLEAFEQAGARLFALDRAGVTSRGLHAILAQHVLSVWNRLGLGGQVQAALACTAAAVVLRPETVLPEPPNTSPGEGTRATLGAVTNTHTTTDPARLRQQLVDHIKGRGTFRTTAVERAFATVPRELFLPEIDVEDAYAPKVQITKRDAGGSALSSASDPNLVATQAEDLDVRPGHKVLEIGAATGINAALMAELAGPHGHVVTIEIDEDLAERARAALQRAGYEHVEVVCGDGAAGWQPGALYDGIVVTAGAWDISLAWWAQLAPGGRIVVPLRLHGSGLTRSIAFDLAADRLSMVGSHARVCGFVPLRGAAAHTAASIPLDDDVALNVDTSDPADADALGRVLTHPPVELWTGLYVGDHEPVEHLDLWLVTHTGGFGRLSVSPAARRDGRLSPALRWAGATVYDGGTIAYLALREHGPISKELGVIAHGPDSRKLATRLAELLQQWSHTRPARPRITAHPAATPDDQLPAGYRVKRPDTRLTISW
ncbi:methyltransferase, FxLD system [Nonomuraea sp. SYSU D8015]|uniref:methyltransferase, FxLD system n=1 Tax=Nonomuraea sp. SYSU D8015 TaxID=2593644 RepID=UPI001661708C|nr:methyltransferase, FxLD system [Nonomuraea sp. SYSU D8015]